MRREINQAELSFFYQKIGEAIWHLQHVEDLLISLHFIKFYAKKPNGITEEEANKILPKLQKLNLGRLIGTVEKESIISTEFATELREFNETRIWVVHHSMRQDGDSLYTTDGRNEFIYKICKFTDKAIELEKKIESEVLDYSEKNGFSREKAIEIANNHINKLKGQV